MDEVDQVPQIAPDPVKLPGHEGVALPQAFQARVQARPVIAFAGGVIFIEMVGQNPPADQGIPLQVQHLAVAVRRDAHVADKHVRKTSFIGFPHSAPFRQGLSHNF